MTSVALLSDAVSAKGPVVSPKKPTPGQIQKPMTHLILPRRPVPLLKEPTIVTVGFSAKEPAAARKNVVISWNGRESPSLVVGSSNGGGNIRVTSPVGSGNGRLIGGGFSELGMNKGAHLRDASARMPLFHSGFGGAASNQPRTSTAVMNWSNGVKKPQVVDFGNQQSHATTGHAQVSTSIQSTGVGTAHGTVTTPPVGSGNGASPAKARTPLTTQQTQEILDFQFQLNNP